MKVAEIKEFVENYNDLPAAERKEGVIELIRDGDLQRVYALAKSGTARAALRILADIGERAKDVVAANIDGLLKLLRADDAKVRMLAAQVIGNTCAADYLDELIEAMMHEQTVFALPSYLLAIGRAKNDRAKRFLESYQLRSDIEKHRDEENAALNKALANFVMRTKARVRVLPTDVVVLASPNLNVTYSLCTEAGLKPRKFGKYIAVTSLVDFYDIYKMRAYTDAYIYLGSSPVSELPAFLKQREAAVMQRTGVTGYRLEVRSVAHEVRIDIIKKCVSAMEQLINTPSSYSVEILIEIDGDTAQVFLNPLTDNRFDYRKKAIAASISPGVAASVCAYASEFFNPDARVLDNFCGSGTMLYERGFYPHHSLTGADINMTAIEAAKENSRYAHVHPQFHYIDALKFTAKKYDEILVNMPFGLRVGTHTQNERLYKAYFRILPEILTDKGIAVLYTHEKNLLEGLIKSTGAFEVLKRATFDAGGLYPAVYVLKKK
ncbi:MAG: methyltransferase [Christensenella sp.]|uniref:methyltransferase n=1 Tax=Christensenella sp. TaxID=1935934 RepID=UPI002B215B6F|nr:methyltransferase [Christensenella sp.]MEA5004004.1 methyltransferase [Christensenella sp.]